MQFSQILILIMVCLSFILHPSIYAQDRSYQLPSLPTAQQPKAQQPTAQPIPIAPQANQNQVPAQAIQPSNDPKNNRIDAKLAPEPLSLREYEERMRDYIATNQSNISIHQVVMEILDDLMADMRLLRLEQISPLAIRGVGLTPNLAGNFGLWTENELISRINRLTSVSLRYCVSCQSLKTSVENGEWVLKLGWVKQEDMYQEAQKLGVMAFMDLFVSYIPGANMVSLSAKIYRADSGAILWSQTYMSDSSTAAILRTGDRIQTRDEVFRELTRKIEQRPYYGYTLWLGGGMVPFAGPQGNINFIAPGIKIYEKFGEDKRFLYALFFEGVINFTSNPILGGFMGAQVLYRINQPNLNDIQVWAGGSGSLFLASLTGGNTVAMEALVDLIMQFRLGLGASLFYAVPVDFGGFDIGGLGYKFRFTFNY